MTNVGRTFVEEGRFDLSSLGAAIVVVGGGADRGGSLRIVAKEFGEIRDEGDGEGRVLGRAREIRSGQIRGRGLGGSALGGRGGRSGIMTDRAQRARERLPSAQTACGGGGAAQRHFSLLRSIANGVKREIDSNFDQNCRKSSRSAWTRTKNVPVNVLALPPERGVSSAAAARESAESTGKQHFLLEPAILRGTPIRRRLQQLGAQQLSRESVPESERVRPKQQRLRLHLRPIELPSPAQHRPAPPFPRPLLQRQSELHQRAFPTLFAWLPLRRRSRPGQSLPTRLHDSH